VLHAPLVCNDSNACTADSCNPNSGCVFAPGDPSDNNGCTNDTCDPVLGVLHTPVVCNDSSICTADSCNPNTGCVFTPIFYFSETFANNNAGWTLGGQGTATPWQIAALIPNPTPPGAGFPDPTLDHTPTNDNSVAGVAIGGNTGNALHQPYYLVSPVINLSAASTPVIFEFYRWLNSDFPPYMDSTIEVYTGAAWVKVWGMLAGVAINDSTWVKQSFDVTAYKNANFQIRWGWQVGGLGAANVSGWNVDDVRLVPAANCP